MTRTQTTLAPRSIDNKNIPQGNRLLAFIGAAAAMTMSKGSEDEVDVLFEGETVFSGKLPEGNSVAQLTHQGGVTGIKFAGNLPDALLRTLKIEGQSRIHVRKPFLVDPSQKQGLAFLTSGGINRISDIDGRGIKSVDFNNGDYPAIVGADENGKYQYAKNADEVIQDGADPQWKTPGWVSDYQAEAVAVFESTYGMYAAFEDRRQDNVMALTEDRKPKIVAKNAILVDAEALTTEATGKKLVTLTHTGIGLVTCQEDGEFTSSKLGGWDPKAWLGRGFDPSEYTARIMNGTLEVAYVGNDEKVDQLVTHIPLAHFGTLAQRTLSSHYPC